MDNKRTAAYRQIMIIATVLLILTVAEYLLAAVTGSAALFFLVALAKGALVVNFFMHVYRLWRPEEAH